MSNNDNPFVPYLGKPFCIPNHLKVVALDPEENIIHKQNLSDYLIKPSIELAMNSHGACLLDVLTNEEYLALNSNGQICLKFVTSGNAHADATKLMGSIAEALIVQECNNSQEYNRELAKHARGGSRLSNFPDGFIAICTGSKLTKRHHLQHYSPNDTQRDIIWVDKQDNALQLNSIIPGSTNASSKPAGLQVKTSHDFRYVLNSIEQYSYPIIYFDLNNDWQSLYSAIVNLNRNSQTTAATLVKYDNVLYELKDRLVSYFNIIVALMNGECTMEQLIQEANYSNDSILGSVFDNAAGDSGEKTIVPVKKNINSMHDEIMANLHRQAAKLFS
ncbi:hypothetical protein AB7254_18405 [Providencia rettgeri]|uniref:hypothetical protein n=1 Tax=Proteus mirabilis TaxID=584 RepID=UPI0023D7BAF8|nr:hypothetical protein [Proteus mirabilis]WEJ01180.1 hypothetical protein P1A26_18140 [Proteus mirabilis]